MDPFTSIIRALIGKKAVDKVANNETVKNIAQDAAAGAEIAAQNVANATKDAVDWVGSTAGKAKEKASKILSDAAKAGKDAFNGALDSYFKLFGLGYKDGQGVYSPELDKMITKLTEDAKKNKADSETLSEVVKAVEAAPEKEESKPADFFEAAGIEKPEEEKVEEKVVTPTEDANEVITYTYKPGDTFGQVLLNLGLSDGTNLWGRGGDVEYYTQQLRDQNMLDFNGNVKLGIPFKLRRRR